MPVDWIIRFKVRLKLSLCLIKHHQLICNSIARHYSSRSQEVYFGISASTLTRIRAGQMGSIPGGDSTLSLPCLICTGSESTQPHICWTLWTTCLRVKRHEREADSSPQSLVLRWTIRAAITPPPSPTYLWRGMWKSGTSSRSSDPISLPRLSPRNSRLLFENCQWPKHSHKVCNGLRYPHQDSDSAEERFGGSTSHGGLCSLCGAFPPFVFNHGLRVTWSSVTENYIMFPK